MFESRSATMLNSEVFLELHALLELRDRRHCRCSKDLEGSAPFPIAPLDLHWVSNLGASLEQRLKPRWLRKGILYKGIEAVLYIESNAKLDINEGIL